MSNRAGNWLIIPLFNEDAVIGDVIRAAIDLFPNIVCVDDGSHDNSALEARSAGAWVVPHPFNLGQGAAIQTGLQFALSRPDSRYFVTFDADGQHSVDDAARMVQRLESEPLDVVIGSRFLDGSSNVSPLKRTVLKLAAAFERASTRLELTDAHNGLRAFNRDAAARINITQNRMAHASEITEQIARLKLRYAEEPVTITYTEYSKSKGQSVWNSINILSDLWIK